MRVRVRFGLGLGLGFGFDLDPATQCGDGAVRPARAAVLGDVLIERGRQVVDAILVPPREIGRVAALGIEEQVVGRDGGGVAPPHDASLLGLLLVPQLRLAAGRLGREGERSNAVEHLCGREGQCRELTSLGQCRESKTVP